MSFFAMRKKKKELELYSFKSIKMEEQNLRILTRLYNGERYMPSHLPPHDELSVDANDMPCGPGFSGFHDYNLGQSIDYDCVELDPDFVHNYNAWLDTEAFDTDIDEQDEIKTQQLPSYSCDTPIPSTPFVAASDDQQFSPEELVFEINKLYIHELNAELKPAVPLTVVTLPTTKPKDDEEAWESPPAPKKLTPLFRYDGSERSMSYLRPTLVQEDEEQVVKELKEHDLDLQLQIQEELISRLFLVQEKIAEKWPLFGRYGKHDNSIYRLKLFDEDLQYPSFEHMDTGCSGDDDDYDENDHLQSNGSYDNDEQRQQDVY